VAVCKFNPLNPAERPGAFGLVTRNHRKLLVVDDEAAFTGGINISSVYASGSGGSGRSGSGGSGGSGSAARAAAVATGPAGAEAGAEAGWRDTHVELRGPVVPALARSFASLWADQRCEGGLGGSGPPRAAQPGDRVVKLVEASPGQGPSRIYTTLLAAVEASRRSVHLTMAYFAPGPEMVRALADAARRGVEVSLVLPGRSDVSLVMQAGRSYYDEMLEAGVHIHEMGHTVMHAKTVVIDGVLATVGSSNMDWRSFTGNHELNVVLLGRDAGAEFEALFARDVAASRRIEPAAWAARGFRQRAHESLARLIEPLL
jgi:cardiolipin synthase